MEFQRVEYRLNKQALEIWMDIALVFKHQTDEKVKEKKQKRKMGKPKKKKKPNVQ